MDCSTDTGKIAAAYGAEVCIFEPTPLIHTAATTHVSGTFLILKTYNNGEVFSFILLKFMFIIKVLVPYVYLCVCVVLL